MKVNIEFLYSNYFESLYKVGYRYLRNSEETEDLIQELFLKVLKGKIAIKKLDKPEAFLIVSLRNMAIDQLRKQDQISVDLDSQQLHLHDASRSTENRELGEDIDRAIGQLPPKTRMVFTLKQLEGKSYKEIAAELQISTNTVENHMSKAFKLLRKHLAHHLALVISQNLNFFSDWTSGF